MSVLGQKFRHRFKIPNEQICHSWPYSWNPLIQRDVLFTDPSRSSIPIPEPFLSMSSIYITIKHNN